MITDLFKNLVWDNLIALGIEKLFRLLPFLGWGPIGFLVSKIIWKFSDVLFEVTDTFIDVKEIPIRNNNLRKEFDRESVKLMIIAREKGIDSIEFKTERENAKKSLSNLVRFNA